MGKALTILGGFSSEVRGDKMTNKSKQKGYRGEIGFAKKLKEAGYVADRDGRPYTQDVTWLMNDGDIRLKCEVKVRKNGFKMLYRQLEKYEVLAMKEDYRDWIVAMKLDTLLALLKELVYNKKR